MNYWLLLPSCFLVELGRTLKISRAYEKLSIPGLILHSDPGLSVTNQSDVFCYFDEILFKKKKKFQELHGPKTVHVVKEKRGVDLSRDHPLPYPATKVPLFQASALPSLTYPRSLVNRPSTKLPPSYLQMVTPPVRTLVQFSKVPVEIGNSLSSHMLSRAWVLFVLSPSFKYTSQKQWKCKYYMTQKCLVLFYEPSTCCG